MNVSSLANLPDMNEQNLKFLKVGMQTCFQVVPSDFTKMNSNFFSFCSVTCFATFAQH